MSMGSASFPRGDSHFSGGQPVFQRENQVSKGDGLLSRGKASFPGGQSVFQRGKPGFQAEQPVLQGGQLIFQRKNQVSKGTASFPEEEPVFQGGARMFAYKLRFLVIIFGVLLLLLRILIISKIPLEGR
jgi:hypothetical protein